MGRGFAVSEIELRPTVTAQDFSDGVAAGGWGPPAGVPMSQWPKPQDISEALVCCYCGVSTPREDACAHTEMRAGWNLRFPPGRVCSACAPLAPAGRNLPRESIVAGLLDPGDPAAVEVLRSLRWFSDLGDWTTPWHPGFVERWAFVDRSVVAAIAREVHERLAPHASRWGTGCAACGVEKSTRWGDGSIAGRTGGYHALCEACDRLVGARTLNEAWFDSVAAAAAGLTGPPSPGFAGRIGFRAFWDRNPGHPGTSARWAFLGNDLERLREVAAQRWPGLLPGADLNAIAREAAQRERRPMPARSGLLLDDGGRL